MAEKKQMQAMLIIAQAHQQKIAQDVQHLEQKIALVAQQQRQRIVQQAEEQNNW